MAGTWRIRVESVEGLRPETGKQATSENADESASLPRFLVLEVGSSRNGQKTKPFEVFDGGNSRVNRVLFIPAPAAGEQVQLRVLKSSAKGDTSGTVGEAILPDGFGTFQVPLTRRQKLRGTLRLHVADGLPTPPEQACPPGPVTVTQSPATPQRLQLPATAPGGRGGASERQLLQVGASPKPSSVAATSPIASSPASSKLAAMGASPRPGTSQAAAVASPDRPDFLRPAGQGLPPLVNLRPLRMRFPGLPYIGNCDVTVEAARLPSTLQRPFLIIGLEGQEFLAEDLSKRLKLLFQFAAVQGSLTVYCYDAMQTHKSPLGRVLVPLADVLWPVEEALSTGRLKAGFQKDVRHFSRKYKLQFLPGNEAGDSHTDAKFTDRFEPHLSKAVGQEINDGLGFGEIQLTVEVTFREEVKSLVGFYLASIVAASKGPGMMAPMAQVPALPQFRGESAASVNILESPGLRSLLDFLWRFKHYCNRPSLGFPRFLKEGQRRYVAGGCWFVFCMLGYFPCSAWVFPLYLWVALLSNGLLAAYQRQSDWTSKESKAREQFWRQAGPSCTVLSDPDSRAQAAFAKCVEQLQEVESMVRLGVLFLERASNLLTLADMPASAASFVLLGGVLASLSLSLLIVGHIEGLSFLCGAYGAFLIISLCKPPALMDEEQGASPQEQRITEDPQALGMTGLFNQAFACVPDQADVANRFVAHTVQALEV